MSMILEALAKTEEHGPKSSLRARVLEQNESGFDRRLVDLELRQLRSSQRHRKFWSTFGGAAGLTMALGAVVLVVLSFFSMSEPKGVAARAELSPAAAAPMAGHPGTIEFAATAPPLPAGLVAPPMVPGPEAPTRVELSAIGLMDATEESEASAEVWDNADVALPLPINVFGESSGEITAPGAAASTDRPPLQLALPVDYLQSVENLLGETESGAVQGQALLVPAAAPVLLPLSPEKPSAMSGQGIPADLNDSLIDSGSSSSSSATAASSAFQLQGVIWDKSDPMAMINGRIRRVGETISDAVVVSISRTSVVLESDGTRMVIKNR